MIQDFTAYLENMTQKTIPGFQILDIKIHEIFQNIRITAIGCPKIAMTQNTAITKGNLLIK